MLFKEIETYETPETIIKVSKDLYRLSNIIESIIVSKNGDICLASVNLQQWSLCNQR